MAGLPPIFGVVGRRAIVLCAAATLDVEGEPVRFEEPSPKCHPTRPTIRRAAAAPSTTASRRSRRGRVKRGSGGGGGGGGLLASIRAFSSATKSSLSRPR